MIDQDKQLREALDSLRLISETVKRTQQEVIGQGADRFIALGAMLVIGFAVSIVLDGVYISAWWVLVAIATGVVMNIRKARNGDKVSKSGQWLLRRYGLIGLGLNVQGWALTLLSLLYNAYPPAYIPVIWMIVTGVSFINGSLYAHRLFAVIGIAYVAVAMLSAMFWIDNGMAGIVYIVVGIVSGFSLIGLGLQLRHQSGRSIAHPTLAPTLSQEVTP